MRNNLASPLIDGSKNRFRTWFRKVWEVRGGGLYACGFAVTFLILEIGSLADDVIGIGALFNGQAIEFLVNFVIDSFKNTMTAFVWPVLVIQWSAMWGAIALGVGYWLFPIYVKPHIEDWLFEGDTSAIDAAEQEKKEP